MEGRGSASTDRVNEAERQVHTLFGYVHYSVIQLIVLAEQVVGKGCIGQVMVHKM